MESVPNENSLAVEGDDRGASSENRKVRVVPHAHLQVGGGLVGDESRLVQEHVIGSARVSNCKLATQVWRDQRIIKPGEDSLKGR